MASVNLHFRVSYHTDFGRNLLVCGGIPELGNWDKPVPLTYTGHNDEWDLTISIPLPKTNTTIKYKYLIDDQSRREWEPEKDHVLNLAPASAPFNLEIVDTYRWQDHVQDAYSRSAFVDAVHHRDTVKKVNYIEAPSTSFEVYFSCVVPHIRSDQKLIVCGSCPELGSWDASKGLEMRDNEYPFFSASCAFSRSSLPFEYKYAIVKSDGYVMWDINENFKVAPLQDKDDSVKTILCLNQYFINPDKALYHGFGIYAPLFSLRSSDSCGIGQYSDIKKLVDVCNKMGASLIQLLPINDTTDKGDWADSYPYRQVSCFALHPIYINLLEITPNLPAKLKEEIKEFSAQQEKQKYLDYPAVHAFKVEKLKQIYQLVKSTLPTDANYAAFKKANASWLYTYSLYCHFRDKYGTSDFHKWPEYSKVSEEEIESLSEKYAKELDYCNWVQYICDLQFRDSRNYAAEHHVALKGDLPIGVYLNSVECWAYPENFRLNMCAGAPPDAFSDQGQNWGFPTYAWDFMEKDHYRWWRLRLQRMGTLFHALRVDHILGFFRIWEIPRETCIGGMLGHFFPCHAAPKGELQSKGLWDIDRYLRPYIRWHLLAQKFGGEAEWASKTFFNAHGTDPADDWYDFKEEYNSERKIDEAVNKMFKGDEGKIHHYKKCLLQLIDNVLMVPDPGLPDIYHPRTEITMEHIEPTPNGPKEFGSPSWLELAEPQRTIIKEFYTDFTYKRQNGLWVSKAKPKLNLLKTSTNMLICAEDLGQLTDGIIQAIKDEALLSLRVQRMSKDPKKTFDEAKEFSYLSVCCPSTHDCSSIRGWWEENTKVIDDFWYNQLLRHDNPWRTCEPWISETILKQHLFSDSMWAIFLLQDVTGITQHLRRQSPQEEQINIPADPHHHWNYRYPYTLEELAKDEGFTGKVYDLCKQSFRI